MYYMHHFYIHKIGMLSLVQWVGSGSVLLGVCETGRGFLTMVHGIYCLIYKCEKILKIRTSAKSLFFILNCSIHAHRHETEKNLWKITNSSRNNYWPLNYNTGKILSFPVELQYSCTWTSKILWKNNKQLIPTQTKLF